MSRGGGVQLKAYCLLQRVNHCLDIMETGGGEEKRGKVEEEEEEEGMEGDLSIQRIHSK